MSRSMMNNFAKVPKAEIPRSSFLRPSQYRTTFRAGRLIPFFLDEALPGDTFNLKTHTFARLSTPVVPIMDNLYFETFFFAVPLRLVWNNFQKFMGQQDNPGDSTDYLIPQTTAPAGGYQTNSLADYFGLPTQVAGFNHSALPFRAYQLIWNEWFRSENLTNSEVFSKGDGPDAPLSGGPLWRTKRFDYFTSANPWPQKGPAVMIPLGERAEIISYGYDNFGSGKAAPTGGTSSYTPTTIPSVGYEWSQNPNGTGIYVDMESITEGTINALRQAFQLQKLYERDARGGTRYTEIIYSHFGVSSPDARLQRPEYLGGSSTPINIHPIAQTSGTMAGSTPQGNLAAMGTMSNSHNSFIKSFSEHSIVIGLCNVRGNISYQQGLDRLWSRRTKWDFYWPALAHIGEQPIYNEEIFTQGTTADKDAFGYKEAWSEYRYKNSQITGEFRSNSSYGSLDSWHLADDYPSLPLLSNAWIQDATDYNLSRCLVNTTTDAQILLDVYHELNCVRPMPLNSVPGYVDHF